MRFIALLLSAALAGLAPAAFAQTKTVHALSLTGEPKYGPDFKQLDYVNPAAPKGGEVKLYDIGSFDTFNPYIVKGDPPAGIGMVFETLTTSPLDDAATEYGLIAESIEVAEDLSQVIFNLRAEAKWHDGKPVTADDVVWSFNTLKEKGAPLYRYYYANVDKAEVLGPRKVRFHFSGPKNRELPQIMGQLPVLPKHWWATREFDKTTLEPPLGSGPYKIAEFRPGQDIVFERVANWWGKDLPVNRGRYNFDRVRYTAFRDSGVTLEAFKGAAYDFRSENSAKNWATGYDFPAVKDGRVIKKVVEHGRPAGMQAFVFNTRRDMFKDARVRQALAYAYDFEWSNKNIYFDQYRRSSSFFQNSELANTGLPSPAELKYLEPLRGKVPPEVFTKTYEPPKTDGSGNIREGLRAALDLLKQAGWTIKNQKLVGPDGKPMEIEFLNGQPESERAIQPFLRNLERLGITGRIRTVDASQYVQRLRAFDYDMIIGGWAQSESPGNEQREFWSSAAADREGSRNYAGIKNPAVDKLIDDLIAAPDRADLVAATRALDRVLLWNHYIIPQLHAPTDRIAFWNRFGFTDKTPKYGTDFMSWWVDPAKDAALKRGN